MKRYADPGAVIQVTASEEFALELEGNPTTGYTWQITADSQVLELLGQEFEASGEGVGAGGQEVCHFRAVAPGQTEIACEYRRPWDKESRDTRRFRIVISGQS